MTLIVDGIVYQLQSYGGISRMFSEILPRICEMDKRVRIKLLTSGTCKQALPAHSQIRHLSAPRLLTALRDVRLAGQIAAYLSKVAMRMRIGSGNGTIWHSTYYTTPQDWGWVSWHGHVVVTVADMIYEKFPQYFAHAAEFSQRKRTCVVHADKVIAISESTKRDLIELFNIPESTVTVTHLAASSVFRKLSETCCRSFRQRLALEKPFILYVGARGGYKNFQSLLKAYSLWKRRDDFDLVCVGGASTWSRDESEMIMEANLGNSVKLFANVADGSLRGFYSCAQTLVYPSFYEGFGLPLLEAMACGTPVIASNTSSLPEILGDAGLYFEPSSLEGLVDALSKVVDNEGLRHQLTTKGLARSRAFSWDKTVAKTWEVYRQLL